MISIHILDEWPQDKGLFEQQHLRSCPFCGSNHLTTKRIHTNKYGPCTLFFIMCNNCGAQGPIHKYKGDPVMNALEQLELENCAREDWGLEYTDDELIRFYNVAGV